MKYSWFINLTTEKQTMETQGVWHPLKHRGSNRPVCYSPRTPNLQQQSTIMPRRCRADVQVRADIPALENSVLPR